MARGFLPQLVILPGLSCLLALGALTLDARQVRPGQQTAPTQQQQAARDQPAQQRRVGTASIAGRVVMSGTGRPVKRARVFANASADQAGGQAASVTTMTDADGRYLLQALPAGLYTVSFSKESFVTTQFGQRDTRRSARRIALRDGERLTDVDIILPRGGVISGHVYDEDGEPLLGASITAVQVAWGPSGRQLQPARGGQTDDRGYYRVFGLAPGTYYVYGSSDARALLAASRPDQSSPTDRAASNVIVGAADEPTQTLGYAPTYYPGTASAAEASAVTVGADQELSDVNFGLLFVPTARIGGTVATTDGTPVQGTAVRLTRDESTGDEMDWGPLPSTNVRPDGSFVLSNVAPGRYQVIAQARMGRQGGVLFASQSVSVSGRDTFVTLTLNRGLQVTGTISFDSAVGTTADLSRVSVSLTPTSRRMTGRGGSFRVQPSGAFAITDVVPGTYLFRVAGFGQAWALKGIYLNGRDVADTPVEFRGTQPIAGVSVVLTDAPTTVSGTVVDGQGTPTTDATVLVFSTDPTQWRPLTRTLQSARPDQSGAFTLRGLPPGDYYLIALVDVDPGAFYNPEVLNGLRQSATRLSLAEGVTENRTLTAVTVGQ